MTPNIITRRRIQIASAMVVLAVLLTVAFYYVGRYAFYRYFDSWGTKLVDLDRQGLLSKEFGAAWQDVLADQAMESEAKRITEKTSQSARDSIFKINGISIKDYPSLSIVARLNEVQHYSNSISITDRKNRPIASMRTNHTRAKIAEFPPALITALLAAEDKNFRSNQLGIEFDSYVRAVSRAVLSSVRSFRLRTPRGTSTITQQVAKLFISRIDADGTRRVNVSVDRKMREMRLAVAIRKVYSDDEILEVYLNHCITSDHGLVGVKDIAQGLFGKELKNLSEAECVYLARMVKWGRNVRTKIIRQCRTDMPRIAAASGWDRARQEKVLGEIDNLSFARPRRIETEYGPLIDLANEYWLMALRHNGVSPLQVSQMDLMDPNSLVRKKGNLQIRLSIDLPLQKKLEQLVNARGYGKDTMLVSDIRIGSDAEMVESQRVPRDSAFVVSVLKEQREFSEPDSRFKVTLEPEDTLVKNIRFRREGANRYRRSCFYYVRKPSLAKGQYFAYCIMDSKTGKMLAYFSKDKLGSSLACYLKNRIPNGSSTAKPILNALNFDMGIFQPHSLWNDSVEVTDPVPWNRRLHVDKGMATGVVFQNSAVRGRGYLVHNHGGIFEGNTFIFDHLASSNNILGVETAYRLNRQVFDPSGSVRKEAMPLAQLLYRIGGFEKIKRNASLHYMTGVRVYKELARIAGANVDSTMVSGGSVPISDSAYSVALGTLELNLCEQIHLFNSLYNNDLIEKPAEHPSLVIESIVLNGDTVSFPDTIKRFHPFSDPNNLRPTYLGMHKRLVSNPADRLSAYDIDEVDTSSGIPEGVYRDDVLRIDKPLSNFAKSGTTDDIIRPFDASPQSTRKTNYGLWNAVIRIDLSRLTQDTLSDLRDITIACVGEGNARYTGARDGKTLHKFVTEKLLKEAGSTCETGFFKLYEKYLRSIRTDSLPADLGRIREDQE